MPLLDNFTRVYPVKCDVVDALPAVPLRKPEAGETKYFVYHSYKSLKIGGTVISNSSCGGRFCDRQSVAGDTNSSPVACGCFYRKDKYKIIMEHFLRIPCNADVDDSKKITIAEFKSLRFDEILFQDGSHRVFEDIEHGDPIATRVIRDRVMKLVELVNKANGWTIVGWVRTGRIRDANEEGNKDATDIAAEDVKPHVTYLYPSNPEDINPTKVPAFKELILTEEGFRSALKKEAEKVKREGEEKKRKATS